MKADQILHRLVRRGADVKPQPPYVSMTNFQPVKPASLGGLDEQVRAVTVQVQGRLCGLEDELPEHHLLDEFARLFHVRSSLHPTRVPRDLLVRQVKRCRPPRTRA